jgi:hypothetical protein
MRASPPPIVRALVLTALLSGCGESQVTNPQIEPPPETPTAAAADVDAFASTLPGWDTFSKPKDDQDEPIGLPEGEDEVQIDGEDYICTTTPYSLTQTPEKVTTLNPGVEVLWVGSLLQGDGYVGGIGSLAELPIRQRAPITVTIDILTEGNTQIVSDPTVATVNQAIGKLISDADAAGHQAGSNIFYTAETAHSLVQSLLKVGASANYVGASIKSSLSAGMSHERRTVTAYYIQRMFTVSMVLPQHPGDVFSNAFTQEMLDDEVADGRMGPDNPPVYVSSVTYGRILMFSFSSEASIAKINATLSALYNGGAYGGGAELEADLQAVMEQASIQVVTVGGDADQALALIQGNNLGSYFSEDAPLTTARPISYTVRNLGDNSIATVSETTSYELTECTAVPESPPTGAEYELTLTSLQALEVADGALEGPNTVEVYYTFTVTDAEHGVQVAAHRPFSDWYDLSKGDVLVLNSPAAPVSITVSYNGLPNQLALDGPLWESDNTGDDEFPFHLSWPGEPLTLGAYSQEFGDGAGNLFRLNWKVDLVKLITD